MSLRLIGTRLWKYQKDIIGEPPYMTRRTFGRFRMHTFHRGDQDPDPHDHQWNFWTFPLTNYVEEYLDERGVPTLKLVRRFRLHYRPATYRHRVLGKWSGFTIRGSHGGILRKLTVVAGDVHTLVFTSAKLRAWGFHAENGRCFIPWEDYVHGGKRGCD